MARRLLVLTVLYVLSAAKAVYPAESATPRFPVTQVTLKEALDSFESAGSSLKLARRSAKSEQCKLGALSIPCLEGRGDLAGQVYYVPPYHVVPRADYPGRAMEIWAPVESTINGAAQFRMWEHLADTQAIFDCHGTDSCSIVVKTTGFDGLAHCEVEVMKGLVGAPTWCGLLGFREAGRTFIQVPIGQEKPYEIPRPKGGGRADFAIKIVGTVCPREAVVNALVLKALKDSPLNLKLEMKSGGRILGAASGRRSSILKGWREFISVRLDVSACRSLYVYLGAESSYEREMRGYGVTVATSLYVNRQNTDRPSDWTMPTDEQSDQWVEGVRDNLRKALTGSCKRGRWVDRKTLICA
jgi:hypothetical protein